MMNQRGQVLTSEEVRKIVSKTVAERLDEEFTAANAAHHEELRGIPTSAVSRRDMARIKHARSLTSKWVDAFVCEAVRGFLKAHGTVEDDDIEWVLATCRNHTERAAATIEGMADEPRTRDSATRRGNFQGAAQRVRVMAPGKRKLDVLIGQARLDAAQRVRETLERPWYLQGCWQAVFWVVAILTGVANLCKLLWDLFVVAPKQ